MRRLPLFAAALAFAASIASAQITPVGPFVGSDSEGFEGTKTTFAPCLAYRPFNNQADLCTPGGSGAHTTGSWGFVCSIQRRTGTYLYSSGGAGGTTEITFDILVRKFGGYFGSNSGNPDATVDFLDVNGALLASVTAVIPADCNWYWNGWDAGAGPLIKRIRITGNHASGAYVQMDDLEIDTACVSTVTSYCTAGTTSSGCNATMGGTGTPSLANLAPFTLDCTNLEGNKNGIFFYGVTGRTASPWGIGGLSWLCVKSPTQRMNPTMNSGGAPGTCQGTYAVDWNAYVAANPNKPINMAMLPGTVVNAQAWFRDPAAGTGPVGAKGTATSNALEFSVCP